MVGKALATNLYDPWLLCQAFVPLMRKNGYGRIVNVSSGAGSLHYMEGGTPAYGISKVALNALTRKLASELSGTGILVNSVDPGWVLQTWVVVVGARWKGVQKVLCGPPHCQMVAPAEDFFMMASLNLGGIICCHNK